MPARTPATPRWREVARQIGGGDWIEALPDGLATPVGEDGRGLSLGQRQLVALARVLLQDPAIVILDEATASVDPLTEAQIQEGLDVVLAERTAIVIAHRLSTIRNADRIIVLRQGRIVEEGSHDALMRAGGPLRPSLQHLLPPPVARLSPRRGLRPVRLPLEPLSWRRRASEAPVCRLVLPSGGNGPLLTAGRRHPTPAYEGEC